MRDGMALFRLFAVLSHAAAAGERASIITAYPHDRSFFTQGLAFDRAGNLFESTGLTGQSKVLRYHRDASLYTEHRRVSYPDMQFGEGLTVVGNELFCVTWKDRRGHVFDADTLALKRTWVTDAAREGWGLTSTADGAVFFGTDGSSTVTLYEQASGGLREIAGASFTVTVDGAPRRNLNELELIGSELWLNVWFSNSILRVDVRSILEAAAEAGADVTGGVPASVAARLRGLPRQRSVHAQLDASSVKTAAASVSARLDVLNGIAVRPVAGSADGGQSASVGGLVAPVGTRQDDVELIITGKLWPRLYHIAWPTDVPVRGLVRGDAPQTVPSDVSPSSPDSAGTPSLVAPADSSDPPAVSVPPLLFPESDPSDSDLIGSGPASASASAELESDPSDSDLIGSGLASASASAELESDPSDSDLIGSGPASATAPSLPEDLQ